MTLGLGPLPWLMNGEIFSEEAKVFLVKFLMPKCKILWSQGTSASIANITHWTSTFLVTRFFKDVQQAMLINKRNYSQVTNTLNLANFRRSLQLVLTSSAGRSPPSRCSTSGCSCPRPRARIRRRWRITSWGRREKRFWCENVVSISHGSNMLLCKYTYKLSSLFMKY